MLGLGRLLKRFKREPSPVPAKNERETLKFTNTLASCYGLPHHLRFPWYESDSYLSSFSNESPVDASEGALSASSSGSAAPLLKTAGKQARDYVAAERQQGDRAPEGGSASSITHGEASNAEFLYTELERNSRSSSVSLVTSDLSSISVTYYPSPVSRDLALLSSRSSLKDTLTGSLKKTHELDIPALRSRSDQEAEEVGMLLDAQSASSSTDSSSGPSSHSSSSILCGSPPTSGDAVEFRCKPERVGERARGHGSHCKIGMDTLMEGREEGGGFEERGCTGFSPQGSLPCGSEFQSQPRGAALSFYSLSKKTVLPCPGSPSVVSAVGEGGAGLAGSRQTPKEAYSSADTLKVGSMKSHELLGILHGGAQVDSHLCGGERETWGKWVGFMERGAGAASPPWAHTGHGHRGGSHGEMLGGGVGGLQTGKGRESGSVSGGHHFGRGHGGVQEPSVPYGVPGRDQLGGLGSSDGTRHGGGMGRGGHGSAAGFSHQVGEESSLEVLAGDTLRLPIGHHGGGKGGTATEEVPDLTSVLCVPYVSDSPSQAMTRSERVRQDGYSLACRSSTVEGVVGTDSLPHPSHTGHRHRGGNHRAMVNGAMLGGRVGDLQTGDGLGSGSGSEMRLGGGNRRVESFASAACTDVDSLAESHLAGTSGGELLGSEGERLVSPHGTSHAGGMVQGGHGSVVGVSHQAGDESSPEGSPGHHGGHGGSEGSSRLTSVLGSRSGSGRHPFGGGNGPVQQPGHSSTFAEDVDPLSESYLACGTPGGELLGSGGGRLGCAPKARHGGGVSSLDMSQGGHGSDAGFSQLPGEGSVEGTLRLPVASPSGGKGGCAIDEALDLTSVLCVPCASDSPSRSATTVNCSSFVCRSSNVDRGAGGSVSLCRSAHTGHRHGGGSHGEMLGGGVRDLQNSHCISSQPGDERGSGSGGGGGNGRCLQPDRSFASAAFAEDVDPLCASQLSCGVPGGELLGSGGRLDFAHESRHGGGMGSLGKICGSGVNGASLKGSMLGGEVGDLQSAHCISSHPGDGRGSGSGSGGHHFGGGHGRQPAVPCAIYRGELLESGGGGLGSSDGTTHGGRMFQREHGSDAGFSHQTGEESCLEDLAGDTPRLPTGHHGGGKGGCVTQEGGSLRGNRGGKGGGARGGIVERPAGKGPGGVQDFEGSAAFCSAKSGKGGFFFPKSASFGGSGSGDDYRVENGKEGHIMGIGRGCEGHEVGDALSSEELMASGPREWTAMNLGSLGAFYPQGRSMACEAEGISVAPSCLGAESSEARMKAAIAGSEACEVQESLAAEEPCQTPLPEGGHVRPTRRRGQIGRGPRVEAASGSRVRSSQARRMGGNFLESFSGSPSPQREDPSAVCVPLGLKSLKPPPPPPSGPTSSDDESALPGNLFPGNPFSLPSDLQGEPLGPGQVLMAVNKDDIESGRFMCAPLRTVHPKVPAAPPACPPSARDQSVEATSSAAAPPKPEAPKEAPKPKLEETVAPKAKGDGKGKGKGKGKLNADGTQKIIPAPPPRRDSAPKAKATSKAGMASGKASAQPKAGVPVPKKLYVSSSVSTGLFTSLSRKTSAEETPRSARGLRERLEVANKRTSVASSRGRITKIERAPITFKIIDSTRAQKIGVTWARFPASMKGPLNNGQPLIDALKLMQVPSDLELDRVLDILPSAAECSTFSTLRAADLENMNDNEALMCRFCEVSHVLMRVNVLHLQNKMVETVDTILDAWNTATAALEEIYHSKGLLRILYVALEILRDANNVPEMEAFNIEDFYRFKEKKHEVVTGASYIHILAAAFYPSPPVEGELDNLMRLGKKDLIKDAITVAGEFSTSVGGVLGTVTVESLPVEMQDIVKRLKSFNRASRAYLDKIEKIQAEMVNMVGGSTKKETVVATLCGVLNDTKNAFTFLEKCKPAVRKDLLEDARSLNIDMTVVDEVQRDPFPSACTEPPSETFPLPPAPATSSGSASLSAPDPPAAVESQPLLSAEPGSSDLEDSALSFTGTIDSLGRSIL